MIVRWKLALPGLLAAVSLARPAPAPTFPANPTAEDIFQARLFEEPLVPLGAKPSPEENAQLARALLAWSQRRDNDDVASLTRFLAARPESPWRVALLTNLGTVYYRTGHFSKCLDAWEKAWQAGRDHEHPLVDRALGELAKMRARLGHMAELEALFREVGDRELRGPGRELIAHARQGLWTMKNEPEIAFRCGPFALDRVRTFLNPALEADPRIMSSVSTTRGTSLAFVAQLAGELSMDFQPAKRERGRALPLPCVVHWKLGHYAALVEEKAGRYRSLDPTFGDEIWISPAALAGEASGYFLIPAGPLPRGWRTVPESEAETVWGRGFTSSCDPNATTCCDPQEGCKPCAGDAPADGGAMATYSLHLLLASLSISDTPVGYSPPRGRDIGMTVTYSQREANQPATFSYSNLGPNWTFNWLSYIKDDPANAAANVDCYLPGGGMVTFSGFNAGISAFGLEVLTSGFLRRTGPAAYELTTPGGTRMLFTRADGAASFPRKVFLTQWIDPQGNAVQLNYDPSLRMTSVADAIGQITTFDYELAADPLKITKVTDPFGRFATFEYDAGGLLTKITDVIGIASQFTYGPGTFINKMTTPYGDTTFTTGVDGRTSWIEATEPDGGQRRVEYNEKPDSGIMGTDPPLSVPEGLRTFNEWLIARNSFYWDREAMKHAPGDYKAARLTHWLHQPNISVASRIPESTKNPLENRVWFNYPNQAQPHTTGSSGQPVKIGRVLDDGTSQVIEFGYNHKGNVTSITDPLGREASYWYDVDGIDLMSVYSTDGPILSQTFNQQHLPLTITDPADKTTTFTYNATGQLLTITNALNQTTSYGYDANGYLLTIDGPIAGAVDATSFTHDAFGRVRTVTDSEGYTLTYDYDAADRLIKITFPDTTTRQFTHHRLDLSSSRDRLGRITSYEYDSVRQLVKVTDPLGRVTRYEWCRCGDLRKLIDPLGQTTTWKYDIQGRNVAKIFADGSKALYQYEKTTSRLRSRTDAKGQTTHFQYFADDRLARIFYAAAAIPTPEVRFAYDSGLPRLLSRTDGTGTTTFDYHSHFMPGALRLASADGPLPNDTVTYTYDEVGRLVGQAINGVSWTRTFDEAGRVAAEANALGTFNYTYVNGTGRMATVTLPNGQTESRTYFGNSGDQLLQQLSHRRADSSVLSRFDYAYNAAQRITSWTQQRDADPPAVFTVGYDAADRLTSVTRLGKAFGYGYDPADNRLSETIDGVTHQMQFNPLNEPINSSGPALTPRIYEWDAEDRLVAIVTGTHRSEFTYDGLSRRVRIVEKDNGTVTSDFRYLWCGTQLCEERSAAGDMATRRFFPQGAEVGGAKLFYSRDHLGSIREVTDSAGTLRARYEYDAYGRRTRVSGDLEADFGFTGHHFHPASGLHLAPFRAYDSNLGRWISRDPLGEPDGPNLYAYVRNDPINATDPLGLETACKTKDAAEDDWDRVEAKADRLRKEAAAMRKAAGGDTYESLHKEAEADFAIASKAEDEASTKGALGIMLLVGPFGTAGMVMDSMAYDELARRQRRHGYECLSQADELRRLQQEAARRESEAGRYGPFQGTPRNPQQ